ncbi:hypothetical protein LBMAG53_03360 [Planctomycetota bacterium]|nr:hypothetical protein LBMAG53_03360 [Planctomycetota bacterium]
MTPRVLHLNWIPEPGRWPGVMAKLAQQARAARGLPLEFVVLTSGESGACDGLRLVPVAGGGLSGRLRRHRLIAGALPLADFTAVVFRYYTGFDCDFSSWPQATARFSEHHTIESAELADGGLRGWAQAGLERWRGPGYLRQVHGLVAVTGEILAYQQKRSPRLPGIVIGNGIEAGAIPVASARPAGGELHLVFASGRFDSWQGLDRLVAGLAIHPGPRVVLHLAGHGAGDVGETVAGQARIIRYGVLDQAGIDRLMDKAHLAVGPLAVHRKGLREACPLKSRDALARGIPLVFAHEDPDLPDGNPGWLRLPADETPIDIPSIVAFARRCASLQPGLSQELRGFAENKLAWAPRMRHLTEFALDVAHGRLRLR